ncbi:hypothetical protein NM688_g810 [Phlebia brevispora]|uniref:Uncharacterized protein n=1 Tax=Phlebia brevispora TaxID=194682 RepID=A0ACC1TD33_9APHY|nr:hypothetical protein NM688_g810 [Phlebia brevispora]
MSTLEFETSIQPAQGFHFSITTKLSPDIPPECTAVNLRFTLPPSVFADPYELDLHRSAFSYHISALPDLELPTSAVDQADIVLDVNAAISSPPIVTVPVHARYGEAKDTGEDMFESIHIKYPKVTLLCQSKGVLPVTSTA